MPIRTALSAMVLFASQVQAQPSPQISPESVAIIRILKHGVVTGNDAVVPNSIALERKVVELRRHNPHPAAHILPSKFATYAEVSRVFALMQKYRIFCGLVGGVQAN